MGIIRGMCGEIVITIIINKMCWKGDKGKRVGGDCMFAGWSAWFGLIELVQYKMTGEGEWLGG